MAYPTLPELKTYLDIDTVDVDAALEDILLASIDYVELYTNRCFSGEPKPVEGEEHAVCDIKYRLGEYYLDVNKDGLRAVSAIKILKADGSEVVLQQSSWRVIKPRNLVYIKASGLTSEDTLSITYTYGAARTLPIIKQIILAYARLLGNQSENDEISNAFNQSTRVGDVAVTKSASVDNLSSSQQVFDSQSKIDKALDLHRNRFTAGV